PNFEAREYDPWVSYGQSKTANVLFSVALEQRFADKGVHAYAVHPGGIQTNLGRHMTDEMRDALMKTMDSRGASFSWKTIPQGAATSCWAATSSELDGSGGLYCEDCNVAEVDTEKPSGSVRPYALDTANADALWDMSERMTGAPFTA
ncbi:hypothetical protein, partial [Sulfitobacter sp.]|uniref:hypothetical protein n=1 Tax=Sulfitobacter sp. TaxID=1903071 RepID=UPI003EF15141